MLYAPVSFMMLSLIMQVTLLRPFWRAYSKAYRTIFSQPGRVISFRHWYTSSVCTPVGGKGRRQSYLSRPLIYFYSQRLPHSMIMAANQIVHVSKW